ncbi:hypothetical protein HPO96_08525 [Kribbella sandramycini]|uniref:Uncharacterized protein n=1 Tax=Kribbella sandramycini TaxID=60450 RepID=A0A7Y4KYQ6_9ACTN|nr:hypothetical protein [Kribbella sandramycini]MBB6569889.1 hypothetical protein [Kribbella sandramycini]NOL40286.1 hypothetical protein [Kribbella sandramycini]
MKHLDEFADLKTLDPATGADPNTLHARATLDRILTTDPTPTPRRPRRRAIRLAVAALAVAVGAAIVFVPRDTGPLPTGEAYAGWTAQPGSLSAKERAAAVKACRKQLSDTPMDDVVKNTDPAIVERRGYWSVVVLLGPGGSEASCMTSSSPRMKGGGYGSIGGPGRPAPGPREISISSLGAAGGGDFGYVTSGMGRVGADIVGITYRSKAHGLVEATVENGYFAFWVPGKDLEDFEPAPVRVTYRDGTSAEVQLKIG